ncbi:zinc finger protein RFP-like isoform X3 [Pelodiscus sinensis]|uniref:zinc finger protein RFP-like isoform X3 n=1 Tax=Pelodiscus sinensis TaxID=13735 RepID=UPI003F6CC0B9
MAASNLAGSFQDGATCPICLEYFTDPVTIECGHNFCQACLSRCWGELEPNFSCPQCRETILQRHLHPNYQLGNLVELVKCLWLPAGPVPDGKPACERHQEALKLFCQEDQAPICVVCDRSWEHRAHTVVPIEEAAQEYKEQILSHLQHLWEERVALRGLESDWAKESERLLGMRSTESRGEEATSLHPAPKCPELERRIRDFPGENSLQGAVTGFLGALAEDTGLRRARVFAGNWSHSGVSDSSSCPGARLTPCTPPAPPVLCQCPRPGRWPGPWGRGSNNTRPLGPPCSGTPQTGGRSGIMIPALPWGCESPSSLNLSPLSFGTSCVLSPLPFGSHSCPHYPSALLVPAPLFSPLSFLVPACPFVP